MSKTELTIRCACGVEHLDIDLFLELDEEDSYMSFSSIFGSRRSWRERFKVVWLILRGKSYQFNELVFDPDKLKEIRDFLSINLERNPGPPELINRDQRAVRDDPNHVHKWEHVLSDVAKGHICFQCGAIKA